VKNATHETLLHELLALREAIAEEERLQAANIEAVLPANRPSAVNLAHYLGLRRRDVRRLQMRLAALGLSSFGRCEGHVRDTLQRLCAWLAGEAASADPIGQEKAEALLHQNTRALLGPKPADRHVYIMVSAPEAQQANALWADGILRAGADVLRINAAHGSAAEWGAIARTFKASAAAAGRPGRSP
jgi:pyruvate kinase